MRRAKITYVNPAACEFAGRRPVVGEPWCVTWRLLRPDGSPLPHDQCPMAVAHKENRPVRGEEAVAERPDGTRVPFLALPAAHRAAPMVRKPFTAGEILEALSGLVGGSTAQVIPLRPTLPK